MEYTTSLTWNTDFPKIGPGYTAAGECIVIMSYSMEDKIPGHPDLISICPAHQQDDGKWGWCDDKCEWHPFEEVYPGGYRILAWTKFTVSSEAVRTLADESNRVYHHHPKDWNLYIDEPCIMLSQ